MQRAGRCDKSQMKTPSTVYYGNTGEWTLDGVAAPPCHGLFWCHGLPMSRFVRVTVRPSHGLLVSRFRPCQSARYDRVTCAGHVPKPIVGFTLLWVVEHVAKLFVASTV